MHALVLAFNLWAGSEAVVIERRTHARYGEQEPGVRAELVAIDLKYDHPLLVRRLTKEEVEAMLQEINKEREENQRLEQWLERRRQVRRTFPWK